MLKVFRNLGRRFSHQNHHQIIFISCVREKSWLKQVLLGLKLDLICKPQAIFNKKREQFIKYQTF